MKKISTIIAITIVVPLFFTLQGCIFVAGAAAGAAGIAVVYDHRKLEQILLDQRIANTAIDSIKADPQLKEDGHINVTSFNRVVLLTGETTTPALRQKAEALVHAIPDITRIYNEITIKGPTSSLTRASDAWITAKIKTQMLATKNLQSGTIKVITENGAVYLMGVVSQNQAETTVDIARQVAGVQKVVKIFQYTNR
jgi:osmotically-inducible protein OsmY